MLSAISYLLAQNIIPTGTNIARRLNLDKSNVNADLKELEQEGKVIKGNKQGREVPYYPADQQLLFQNVDEEEESLNSTK